MMINLLTPVRASRDVRRALGAAGCADVHKVTSRPAVAGTGFDRAIRTDVQLSAFNDPDRIATVLAALPDVLQTVTTPTAVAVYRAQRATGGTPAAEPGRTSPRRRR